MGAPWLHIVGMGADGLDGLAPAARRAVDGAELVVSSARLHALTPGLRAERVSWPSPFDALVGTLTAARGRRVAVLATGDPLWFSVGARLAREFAGKELAIYPHVSAFQLAAARMGWPLAEVETLTAHGRPVAAILPHLYPGARLIILAAGAETASTLASVLVAQGCGDARITALEDMGGAGEARSTGRADEFSVVCGDFVTLCVELCSFSAVGVGTAPGLPDDAFQGDGTMTKAELRATALAKLRPYPGAVLWDVGAGCGSVSVEWMRAALRARALAIEPREDRRAFAAANAEALGTPGLTIIAGTAPEALGGLEAPDAVFVGGGLSDATFAACYEALRPGGRIVAHAVTLEREAVLLSLQATHGGELSRISVQRAEAVGRMTGWKPMMPVTQYSLVKS